MGARQTQFTFTLAGRPLSGYRTVIALLITLAAHSAAAAGSVTHGNQLNTDNRPSMVFPDPSPFNIFQQNTRTPSGFLYPDAWKRPDLKTADDGDWQYSLSLSAGVLGVSDAPGPAAHREYGDWDDGFILNRFDVFAMNPRTAHYIGIYGGSTGRSDQYVQASAGKYGEYNLTLAFDSIPHVFATNARVLWGGAGADNLALPSPLVPGAGNLSAVLSALQHTGPSTLALEREKALISFDFSPSRMLKISASGSIEWREGTRPFGGGFTYPGLGQAMETVEPINYTTNEVSVGLTYVDDTYQANLSYAGSFFRNHYSTLTWENPGLTPFVTFAPEQGRFALVPDNNNHNLRGDFATSLPFWNSRLTTSLSYNQSNQNDALIPPTISSGTVGGPSNTIDLNDWNTPGALSTERADAEIEALDLHAKLTMHPQHNLGLTGEFRYRDQDNHTDYTAFNPLTGEYGYIALDGGPAAFGPYFSGIYHPTVPGNRVRFRSMPFDKDTLLLTAGADYNLASATNVSAYYEHEEMRFSYREVDEVTDDRFQIGVTHRHADWGTLRLSYEYTDRHGDEYIPNPYEPFYTSSLPGFIDDFPDGNRPNTLSAMRKFDMTDKFAHTVNAKVNVILNDKMDVMASGSYVENDYDADYGLRYSESVTANIEWNYQFAQNASIYSFYSYQEDERELANIKDANPVSANPDPGGPVYPLNRAWSEEITETNHTVGTGLNFTHGDFILDLNYSYLYSNSRFRYDFASPAAFLNQFTLNEAGSGFPDQKFRHHLLEGNLRWQARDNLGVRLLYRFESEDLEDFHYQGLSEPLVGDQLYLVTIPENYSIHVIGLIIETSF